MKTKQFEIIADTGIHARPATLLVQTANKFTSDIYLEHGEKKANLKSILGVMSLGIGKGASISISADGADAEEALNSIETLLKTEAIIEQ